MERNQFTFYASFEDAIKNLRRDRDKLQAYEMITAFALHGTQPDLSTKSPAAATVFRLVRPTLEAAAQRAQRYRQTHPDPPGSENRS